jgi:enamine deaminase RidA (YjgF/YER057c/UK114 family)
MYPIIRSSCPLDDAEISFVRFDVPHQGLRERLKESLAECDSVFGLQTAVRQTFFISPATSAAEIATVVNEAYGENTPPTTYVRQTPADGHAVSCELWTLAGKFPILHTPHLALATPPSAAWGFIGGTTASPTVSGGESVGRLLRQVQGELRAVGLDFQRIVRTWFYIGGILEPMEGGTCYDSFNAARNEFYRDKWNDLVRSPASTGIGTDARDVVFEGLVVLPKTAALQTCWLDNPLQTPPYLYDIACARTAKPSFSRAAALRFAHATLTFISGAASIRGSVVIHEGDAAAQTEATVENIAALLPGEGLAGLRQLRVYIKRPEDVAAVRAVCRARLPDVPCAWLIGDVCRRECLVEIEGVHFAANVFDKAAGDGEDA